MDFGAGIQNPKSPIQTFLAKFSGFWILDRYVAILYVRPQRPIFSMLAGILDFGSWGYRTLDFGDFGLRGFWILGILDFGDFGIWIFGILGILDFGFLEHYVADLYVQSLGFGILDFGDLGFWILEIFGVWGTGDFGLASRDKILDAT